MRKSAPPTPGVARVLGQFVAALAAAWLLGGCAAGIMLGDDGASHEKPACRDGQSQDCRPPT